MCTLILIGDDLVDNQGELKEALGGDPVMEYGSFDERVCCCPVDLEKTAAKYGYKARNGWLDAGVDVIFERSDAALDTERQK